MEWKEYGVQKHLYAHNTLVGIVKPHRTPLFGTVYHWTFRRVNGSWSELYKSATEEAAIAYVETALNENL